MMRPSQEALDILEEGDESSLNSGRSGSDNVPIPTALFSGNGFAPNSATVALQLEDDSPKVQYSLYQARSVSLDVLKLRYIPAPVYINEAARKMAAFAKLDKCIGMNISDWEIRHTPRIAPLHNVSFCVPTHRLTALIGTSFAEQCTLIDLIAGRCTTGSFHGQISINGISEESFYSDKFAFVPSSIVTIPGFTYLESVKYAARLRLSHLKVNVSIDNRVQEVLTLMGLRECQHRVIPEFPPTRGELGRDLRLLSIAIEIVTLPPLIIIDDPVLSLEPGVANKLFERLRALTDRGHVVLCNIPKLNPLLIPHFQDVVMLSEGYSVYSGSISGLERYFCSNDVGYSPPPRGVDVFTFLRDIANGTERPISDRRRRFAVTPQELQAKFEASKHYLHPEVSHRSVSAFSKELFYLLGYGAIDSPVTIAIRAYVTIERSLVSKIKDTETIKRSLGGSIVVGLIIGYIQFGQGSYGYYTMTLAKYPYLNTSNCTALLFFCSVFVFSQQLLNAHIVCRKVQLFLYEQNNRSSPTSAFMFGTLLSEIPPTIFYGWIFSSIIYFMADLNKGFANYFFFVYTVCFEACIGTLSVLMFAAVLHDEIAVRDFFFAVTFLMLMLSGFPFQLSSMNDFLYQMSTINPTRYCFEALMAWKFADYYADGVYYLAPFTFQNFQSEEVFTILRNFVIFAILIIYFALWPKPMLMKPIDEKLIADESAQAALLDDSDDDDLEVPLVAGGTTSSSSAAAAGSAASGSATMSSILGAALLGSSTPKRTSKGPTGPETQQRNQYIKPVIFSRESSISQMSKLSINGAVSITGASSKGGGGRDTRGPTVAFRDITYKVKDRNSPLGYKVVINNATGQFDWGKLNCIMGGTRSGKSSLLHIIAGDIGPRTDLEGTVYYNNKKIDMDLPLWQRCALVEAKDEQYVFLTVRETILYAMQLRCVAGEQSLDMVPDSVKGVLQTLHLDDVADKKVKYLTPGQRKRLSIAEEIVFGPTLLLIDEPTTGLSPVDESVMMMTFREMVNQDRTVVATLHEPSPNSFRLFDKIILLSKGRVIYHGPAPSAYKFFINCPYGFDFKPYMANPGEFLLDISCGLIKTAAGDIMESSALEEYYKNSDGYKTFISAVMRYQEQESYSYSADDTGGAVKLLYDSFPSTRKSSISGPSGGSRRDNFFVVASSGFAWLLSLRRKHVGIYLRISWLVFHRAWLALINRWHLIVASIVGHILLACLIGWIVGDASTNLYNSTSFFAVSALFLLLFNLQFIFIIFKSNEVFLKENARDLCPTLIQWLLAPLPLYCLRFVTSIIYSVVVYPLLNLNAEPDIFGYFIVSNMFLVMGGTMMAEAIVQAVPDIRSAYVLIPALVFIQFAFSGLFIKQGSLPPWLAAFAPDTSMIRWSMQGNFINQFQYNTTVFPPNNVYDFYLAFLQIFSWQGLTRDYCVLMILVFCFAFKLLSLLVMSLTAVYQRGGRSFKKQIEDFSE